MFGIGRRYGLELCAPLELGSAGIDARGRVTIAKGITILSGASLNYLSPNRRWSDSQSRQEIILESATRLFLFGKGDLRKTIPDLNREMRGEQRRRTLPPNRAEAHQGERVFLERR